MGGRLLMLTHTGRTSGLARYAVLEVVDHGSGVWYIAAAYGDHADWFRNVKATPNVEVNYRGATRPAVATVVSEEEGASMLRRYAAAHPKAARSLGRLMSVHLEGDMVDAAREIPIVRLSAG
jgi:deazaflavin-dependent oxidoreductase (nitroreductase family)